jgi:hypothetical protein
MQAKQLLELSASQMFASHTYTRCPRAPLAPFLAFLGRAICTNHVPCRALSWIRCIHSRRPIACSGDMVILPYYHQNTRLNLAVDRQGIHLDSTIKCSLVSAVQELYKDSIFSSVLPRCLIPSHRTASCILFLSWAMRRVLVMCIVIIEFFEETYTPSSTVRGTHTRLRQRRYQLPGQYVSTPPPRAQYRAQVPTCTHISIHIAIINTQLHSSSVVWRRRY